MSGFSNPILGGGGALVYPSIHSPNFVSGSTGWDVSKDGSSEFNNVKIRGTVSGSTFDGTNFVINSSGAFFYSGSPAFGNLIYSIAPSSGTDAFGNSYLAGSVSYANDAFGSFIQQYLSALTFGNSSFPTTTAAFINLLADGGLQIAAGNVGGALQLNQDGTIEILTNRPLLLDNSSVPASSTSGPLAYGAGGNLRYVGGDGNAYQTGKLVAVAAGQTVTSATPVGVTGMSCSVAAGTYVVRFWLLFHGSANAGGANVNISCPAVSSSAKTSENWALNGASTTVTSNQGQITQNHLSQTLSTTVPQKTVQEGVATFSASGTLQVTVGLSVAGDNCVITGGVLEVTPVS